MTFAGGIFPVNYLGAARFFDLDSMSWTVDTALLAEELARTPIIVCPRPCGMIFDQSADLDTLKLAALYGVSDC